MGKRSRSIPGAKRRRSLDGQVPFNKAVKSACDIMRRGNVTSAKEYVAELTWILFLRILDETEEREAEEARILGHAYAPSIGEPYRWTDWARPIPVKADAKETNKRRELTEEGSGRLLEFINGKLIPHLKKMRDRPEATPRQKVIAEILSGVERTRIDTETNLLEVLDKIHEISQKDIDPTHVFALSQVYEGLLLKMGEKGSDAGQFFTPREVIRAMVRVVDPKVGERVYDPCCGTGGFLAQAAQWLHEKIKRGSGLPKSMSSAAAAEIVRHSTFYGREKENLIYPIGLANLILHGIDDPHIWHGNTLTGQETYGGLYESAPTQYDIVLTNPPFGGKEGQAAQTGFDFRTGATQTLFVQLVLRSLTARGRCGIVVDDGFLSRVTEEAFVKTKKKLVEDCELFAIVVLPPGVFINAGAGVKTDLLFFNRGKPTEKIWYYDLSDRKVGKRTPLTVEDFKEFFELLGNVDPNTGTRPDSEKSWTMDFTARRRKAADDARPFRTTEAEKKAAADLVKDRLTTLKQARPRNDDAIEAAEAEVAALLRESRDAANKAQAIDDGVYDLKAVNPNKKTEVDLRTPSQLLDLIETKGREVADAVAVLRAMA